MPLTAVQRQPWGLGVEEKENILEEGTGLSSISKGMGINISEEQSMRSEGSKLYLSGWPFPPATSIETLGGSN